MSTSSNIPRRRNTPPRWGITHGARCHEARVPHDTRATSVQRFPRSRSPRQRSLHDPSVVASPGSQSRRRLHDDGARVTQESRSCSPRSNPWTHVKVIGRNRIRFRHCVNAQHKVDSAARTSIEPSSAASAPQASWGVGRARARYRGDASWGFMRQVFRHGAVKPCREPGRSL